MFNIYDDGVRSFTGTLERLYDVRPVEAISPTRRTGPDPEREGGQAAPGRAESGYALSPAAVSAYRNATKLPSREPILHVHQIMQAPVVSVRGDADVREAWLLLREHGIRQAPVQTPEVELVGLLSERQLLEQLIIDRDEIRYGEPRLVAQVMQREVITAEPVTEVRRVARVMADRQMTAMPVVTSEGELVGIVSRGDLLRAMTRSPPLTLWA